MTYIIIQSGVPDLASQLELMTAFATEYMQEAQDGCLISKTYLQLLGCFTYLTNMDLKVLQAGALEDASAVNSSINHEAGAGGLDESFMGLNTIIALAQKTQNRQTMKKKK